MKTLKMLDESGVEVANGEPLARLVVEVSLAEYAKLRTHRDFVNVALYSGVTPPLRGEVGQIENCRIVLSPETTNEERAEMSLDYLRSLVDD